MTIMALVVTVLYSAFSTGVRVWTDQDNAMAVVQERFIVSRQLGRDFERLRPYNFSWEKGEDFFFAGDRSTLFYATANGFAAQDRDKGEIFFACAFLERDEENATLDLRIFKTAYPKRFLIQALEDFQVRAEEQDNDPGFTVPEDIRKQSIVLLHGLDEAGFVINFPDRVLLEEENATRTLDDVEQENATRIQELEDLEDDPWKRGELPASIQLTFTQKEKSQTIFARVALSDVEPEKQSSTQIQETESARTNPGEDQ
jgi:hypothetical protein